MKKYVLVQFICLLILVRVNGQQNNPNPKPPGNSNLVSLNLLAPIGEFAQSHIAGVGLSYNWSHHHYGRPDINQMDSLKRVAFMLSGGVEYYIGKKDINTAGYPFSYGNYLYVHAMPGILYHVFKNADINLAAGPTLGIYKSSADFGFGINMNAEYFFQPTWAIGPGVCFKKHPQANALWSVGVRVGHSF